MAHKWARWLHNPCRLGGPHRFRAGEVAHKWANIEVAHKWARWHPCRLGGPHHFSITPAAWGVPTASERGAESEVAHKWARWLHNPCRLGGSPPLQSGGQNQRWPTSGQGGYITPAAWGVPTASERGAESEVAHKWARWLHNPCRLGGSPPLQSGGQNQRWPTSGQGGYITPAALGGPHRFRAGGRIRGGPQVGKVAT